MPGKLVQNVKILLTSATFETTLFACLVYFTCIKFLNNLRFVVFVLFNFNLFFLLFELNVNKIKKWIKNFQ